MIKSKKINQKIKLNSLSCPQTTTKDNKSSALNLSGGGVSHNLGIMSAQVIRSES